MRVKSLVGSLLQKYRYISNEPVNTRSARVAAWNASLRLSSTLLSRLLFTRFYRNCDYTTTYASLCLSTWLFLISKCPPVHSSFFFVFSLISLYYYVTFPSDDSLDARGTLCTSLLHRIKSSSTRGSSKSPTGQNDDRASPQKLKRRASRSGNNCSYRNTNGALCHILSKRSRPPSHVEAEEYLIAVIQSFSQPNILPSL